MATWRLDLKRIAQPVKPKKSGYVDWTETKFDSSGALTPEKIEAAVKRIMEEAPGHPCQEGHLWNPKQMAKKKGHCQMCGTYVDLTGGPNEA